jgi:hypothetical protein
MNFVSRYTYSEYMEKATKGEPVEGSLSATKGRASRSLTDHFAGFSGTDSFEHAVKLAEEGWTEGREFMGQIVDKLDHITTKLVTRPETVLDVTGDYVDVAVYLEGIPECMVQWQEVETTKRVARIMVNGSVSSGTSKEVIKWRGATVLALIDRLEAQGIRVELDLINNVVRGGHSSTTFVTLKEASEPLHLDRLAFHLAHPSSLRRLMISLKETRGKEEVQCIEYYDGKTYGTPSRWIDGKGEYDLCVPEMNISTIDESVEMIEQMFDVICGVEKIEMGN